MHHDARAVEVIIDPSDLLYCHSFGDEMKQSIGGDFKTSRYGDTTGGREKATQVIVKTFFKTNIRPPVDHKMSTEDLEGYGLHQGGWCGFIHKMKSTLTGLCDQRFHPVNDHFSGGGFVIFDVVQ